MPQPIARNALVALSDGTDAPCRQGLDENDYVNLPNQLWFSPWSELLQSPSSEYQARPFI
jgi:hypothetical protein